MRRVAEIVGIFAPRQRRACRRFHGDDAPLASATELQAEIWESKAGEVRTAARATDDDVGIVACQRKLLDRFLTNNRLVQQHVVEH